MRESSASEHFESEERRRDAIRLGMWIFLASEVLLFAGLFVLWAAYRARHPSGFAAAVAANTTTLGTVNTVVLVTSSLLVALALWASADGRRRLSLWLVIGTSGFGLVFLGVKGVEYALHVQHGLLPGRAFAADLQGPGPAMFYTLYWLMTGLHAAHVAGAVIVLSLVAARMRGGRTDPAALEAGGMYWHLVDIVWLFLWPVLYLVR